MPPKDTLRARLPIPSPLRGYMRYALVTNPVDGLSYSVGVAYLLDSRGGRKYARQLTSNVFTRTKRRVQGRLCESVPLGISCALGCACDSLHVTEQGWAARRLWSALPASAGGSTEDQVALYTESGEEVQTVPVNSEDPSANEVLEEDAKSAEKRHHWCFARAEEAEEDDEAEPQAEDDEASDRLGSSLMSSCDGSRASLSMSMSGSGTAFQRLLAPFIYELSPPPSPASSAGLTASDMGGSWGQDGQARLASVLEGEPQAAHTPTSSPFSPPPPPPSPATQQKSQAPTFASVTPLFPTSQKHQAAAFPPGGTHRQRPPPIMTAPNHTIPVMKDTTVPAGKPPLYATAIPNPHSRRVPVQYDRYPTVYVRRRRRNDEPTHDNESAATEANTLAYEPQARRHPTLYHGYGHVAAGTGLAPMYQYANYLPGSFCPTQPGAAQLSCHDAYVAGAMPQSHPPLPSHMATAASACYRCIPPVSRGYPGPVPKGTEHTTALTCEDAFDDGWM